MIAQSRSGGKPGRNGHADRLLGIAADALKRAQRDVVAAAAFDLSAIVRHAITFDLFDDLGCQAFPQPIQHIVVNLRIP